MLSEEQIRSFLEDRNLRVVAEKSGIAYQRLTYFVRESQKPQFELVHAVAEYLEKNARDILGV